MAQSILHRRTERSTCCECGETIVTYEFAGRRKPPPRPVRCADCMAERYFVELLHRYEHQRRTHGDPSVLH